MKSIEQILKSGCYLSSPSKNFILHGSNVHVELIEREKGQNCLKYSEIFFK